MARKTQNGDSAPRDALVKTGIFVLLAAVAAVGCVVGVRKTWRAIAARPEFLVCPAEAALASPWVRAEEMKKDFLRTDPTGILKSRVSIFTPGLTGQVAAAYAASPWVRRVLLVSKDFPNRLNVQLELREPFALVQTGGPFDGAQGRPEGTRTGGKYYCVDAEGALLSPAVYNLSGERLLSLAPFVTLGEDSAVPCAGRKWDRAAVQEGLAMVRLCRKDLAGKVAVREIQLQGGGPFDNAQGRPEGTRTGGADESAVMAWLVLQSGPRVLWGRPPSAVRSPVEVPSQVKTAALLAVAKKEGAQISRFKTIDIRWPSPLCE